MRRELMMIPAPQLSAPSSGTETFPPNMAAERPLITDWQATEEDIRAAYQRRQLPKDTSLLAYMVGYQTKNAGKCSFRLQ